MYFQEMCGFSDSVFSSSSKRVPGRAVGLGSKLLPDLADLKTVVFVLSWSCDDCDGSQMEAKPGDASRSTPAHGYKRDTCGAGREYLWGMQGAYRGTDILNYSYLKGGCS